MRERIRNLTSNLVRSNQGVAEPDVAGDVSLDDLLEMIENERRRWILREVAESGEPLSVSELSERRASEFHEKVTSTNRKRIYVSFYQTHLDRLDDTGLIDYDRDMVSSTEATKSAIQVIEYAEMATAEDE